jgi:hypothetical protein
MNLALIYTFSILQWSVPNVYMPLLRHLYLFAYTRLLQFTFDFNVFIL